MFGAMVKAGQLDSEQLLQFVKSAGYNEPTPLQEKVLALSLQGRDLVVESKTEKEKTSAMLLPLLLQVDPDEIGTGALMLTGSSKDVSEIQNEYRRTSIGGTVRPSLAALGFEANLRKELRLLSKQPDIIVGTPERIIDHIRRNHLSLDKVKISVLDVPDNSDEVGFGKDVQFIYSKLPGKLQTVVYVSELSNTSSVEEVLRRPQQLARTDWDRTEAEEEETPGVKEITVLSSGNEIPMDEGIKEILKIIKEEENPDILDSYKKTFKKQVPIHLRSYFTAYLLKEYLARGIDLSGQKKSLFISVGRSRKVYPRDLTRLIADSVGIDPGLIGRVKVLDNYSFIDVPKDIAQKTIAQLDGSEFRGRRITVNYARKKEDT